MSAGKFGCFFEDRLNIVNLDGGFYRGYLHLLICPRGVMMVMMVMWCTLDMVVMVHLLAWRALWEARLSSIDWS
jgi:hypothetical protein